MKPQHDLAGTVDALSHTNTANRQQTGRSQTRNWPVPEQAILVSELKISIAHE
jgi:hypothetical protein